MNRIGTGCVNCNPFGYKSTVSNDFCTPCPAGATCNGTSFSCPVGGCTSIASVAESVIISGNWTWLTGSNAVDQNGVYGLQGVSSAGNVPGARSGHSMSMDTESRVFYVWGGFGRDNSASNGTATDLRYILQISHVFFISRLFE